MKSLVQYIKEACEDSVAASKSFSLDLSAFENADETIKSAKDIAEKAGLEIEAEDGKIKVTVKKEDIEKASGLFEMLQDYLNARHNDTKAASDEAYAQKVKSLLEKVSEFFEWSDDAAACGEEDGKEKEDKGGKKEEKDGKKEGEEE